jgi:hypothetical protein
MSIPANFLSTVIINENLQLKNIVCGGFYFHVRLHSNSFFVNIANTQEDSKET